MEGSHDPLRLVPCGLFVFLLLFLVLPCWYYAYMIPFNFGPGFLFLILGLGDIGS